MASNYRNRSSKKPKPHGRPGPVPEPKEAPKKLEDYQREHRHPSGREWTRIVANCIAYYEGICHLCEHPGAKQADHVVPYAESRDDSINNLRPAHGSAGKQKNPCPVCGINCNNVRGALSVEAGRAKILRRQDIEPGESVDDARDW